VDPTEPNAEGGDRVARRIEGTAVQWRALGFLSLAELLGMTLWFSATAVVPTLEEEWRLSSASTAWLTMSVQIGFVAGTFLSAFLNLPDIVNSRRLFAASAALGAGSNAVFTLYALDTELDLAAGATKSRLLDAMEGHVLAQVETVGKYQTKPTTIHKGDLTPTATPP